MTSWLRYLIALLVASHGLVYINLARGVLPGVFEGWRGSSWLLGSAITGGRLETLVLALHVTAGIVILACAVAIAFVPSAPSWWRSLAIAGAGIGIVSFSIFWDGQTQRLVTQGAIGAGISLILLVSAIAFPQAFR